jgi:hypothetical protein
MRVLSVMLGLVSACGFRVSGSGPTSDGPLDSLVDAQVDAEGPATDARADAPIAPLTCDVASWPHSLGGTSRYYVGANKTFDDSQTACVARGGRLAIIETSSENAAVATLLETANATAWTWIGLSDRTVEGVDVWVDAVPVLTTDFTSYNPKIGAAADCYDFSKNPGGGKWGDWYCTDPHSYLCECDPSRPMP